MVHVRHDPFIQLYMAKCISIVLETCIKVFYCHYRRCSVLVEGLVRVLKITCHYQSNVLPNTLKLVLYIAFFHLTQHKDQSIQMSR